MLSPSLESSPPTDALSSEALAVIAEEESILVETIQSIENEIERLGDRARVEELRSREITADILATRRVEDKVQFISDEHISHTLKTTQMSSAKTLGELLSKPYFARVVVEEDLSDGRKKEFEFKLGSYGHLAARIIDWKRAPIAKLYYEYSEGSEFSEEILGQEKEGRIKLRRILDIREGRLMGVTCSLGSFRRNARPGEAEWIRVDSARNAVSGGVGRLPDILSLITKEQFRAITEDATGPVIVRGVAGSGKTTVALYRLAWLLANVSDQRTQYGPAQVIVKSAPLASFIHNSLPALQLEGVQVRTYAEHLDKRGSDTLPPKFLVIDETQELTNTELLDLTTSLKDLRQLTLVGDERQSWSGLANPLTDIPALKLALLARFKLKPEDVGADFKVTALTTNHRSSLPIIKLANHFVDGSLRVSGREGRVPILFQAGNEERAVSALVKWLNIAADRYPGSISAVICRDMSQVRYLKSVLTPDFGELARTAELGAPFSFESGIVILECAAAKGLEFTNVVIWDVREANYRRDDPASKRMLYTAVTRAEENLSLFTWGGGPLNRLLPLVGSGLLRFPK